MDSAILSLLGAFLAITGTVFVLGWILSQAGQKDEVLRTVSLIVYGLGGLAFLGTIAFGLTKPDYLAGTGEALKIAPARSQRLMGLVIRVLSLVV